MNAHILLVEDDTTTRTVLALHLDRAGYQVTQATDGGQAIELLEQAIVQQTPYEVVLTDLVMGEIDGIEVLNTARTLPYAPEVIVLTGFASLDTAIAAVEAGAFNYLLKPGQIPLVLERVAAARQFRQQKQYHIKNTERLKSLVTLIDTFQHENEPTAALPDRQTSTSPDRFREVGLLRINTYRHAVWFDSQPLHLTPTEYEILLRLAETPARVVSYRELAAHTHNLDIDEREAYDLLRFHIRNLRRKFDRRYLVNVRQAGYMLDVPATGPVVANV